MRARTLACAGVALVLAAGPVAAQVSPTAILDRVRVDTRRPIDFHAAAFPESVYVGQQITYQVAVFLTESARSRLRRNPEFIPPELRGLLAYEIGRPRPVPARVYGGTTYEAVVFQRAMFPVAVRPLAVPSPQLTYALPQSSSYFSREERHTVRAESAHVVVKPLPAEGRPDGFSGAVGVLKATARLDTTVARVGDPLVLTLRVHGVGNVKLLPRPLLEIPWASAVPGTERVQIDTSGALVRGAKEFDWILTPTREGRVVLPPLRYDHFDPYAGRYAAAMTAPMEVPVRAGALAAADIGESAALMPLRAGPTTSWAMRMLPTERALQAAAPVVALLAPLPALLLVIRRRRPRPARASGARTARQHPLDALQDIGEDGAEHARRARRALHAALAERLGVPPQALVSRAHTRRLLRRRGVTRAGTRHVLDALDELDARGFAGTASVVADDAQIVRDCYAIVDAEAVQPGREVPGGSRQLGLLLAIAIPVTSVMAPLFASSIVSEALQAQAREAHAPAHAPAQVAGSPRTGPDAAAVQRAAEQGADQLAESQRAAARRGAVQRASQAYQQRQFQDAAQQYADLAAQHPDDVDLLANWGTAAWAAGDTVSAVIAWQRAGRADPLALDIQERVALLPSGARGGIADVPMVPVRMLGTIALACWVAGWLALAWQLRRSGAATHGDSGSHVADALLQGVAWTCLVTAVAAGGMAWWGARALDARSLAVVSRPETMHVAPGTDADAMGGVATGDVVKRLEDQGAWQRVRHADGREGWLPRVRLVDMLPQPADSTLIDPRVGTGTDSIGVSAVPVRP